MLCSHDWQPRSGMDSGSQCCICGKVSALECTPSSGLVKGSLRPAREACDRTKEPTLIATGTVKSKSWVHNILGHYPTR